MAITLMLVFSTVGVVTTADDTRQDESELLLRIAMQDDIRTTNPLNAGGVWTWNVIGYLYDGPINVDPATDKLVPYIAVGCANQSDSELKLGSTDWSDCTYITTETPLSFNKKEHWENPDKSEATIFYDFTNVTWHDGVQMNLKDLLFSYHVQAQMPDWTASVNCLKDKGGRAGSNYPNDHKLFIEEVMPYDPVTHRAALKFTIQEPFADFFRNTLSAFLLPYHIWGCTAGNQNVDNAKIWYEPGYDKDTPDAWSADAATAFDNDNPVGSGPFYWDFWDPTGGVSKIKTFRDHFYRPGYAYDETGLAAQPVIDAMLFKIYKTAEAAVLALRNNDVDYIAWSIPPTFVGELANEPGVTLQQSPEQGFFYLSYNMRLPSFGYDEAASFPYAPSDDLGKPFRKAVAHCIDKQLIVRRLLLSFGIAGAGPVSSVSDWYNDSIPKYSLDPEEAKRILADAGYQLEDGSIGQAAIDKAGDGNWWVNPDGSQIGSTGGGKIEILTPQADYDPIRAQAGLMIAKQMRDVGINAESISMDFGSIVDRIDNRDFDMYILGWRIGSDPTDFLHAFFHSSTAVAGQNYPGYQNLSYDEIIDHARRTGEEAVRKQDINDCQAAIAFDLPYDVLYFRTNIEAYRSDNFVGWEPGSSGSIYNWNSIFSLRQPTKYKLNAQFDSPPSSLFSNTTGVKLDVIVKDQDRLPVKGAEVLTNASHGALTVVGSDNLTDDSGRLRLLYTAPYVESNVDTEANGTTVILQIKQATYTSPEGIEYDPATSRLALIKVFPEGAKFLSVKMSANPDVIDPDLEEDGTFGFTYVEVEVEDQYGDPAVGVMVAVEVDPSIPGITPRDDPSADYATTDSNGKATFTLTSTDLPDNDDSIKEFTVLAKAISTDSGVSDGEQSLKIFIVDTKPPEEPGTPFPTFLVVASLFCMAAVSYGVTRKARK